MPNTLTLTPSITSLSRPNSLKINLSDIFRSQGFKLALETITLISLLTATFIWFLAIPRL